MATLDARHADTAIDMQAAADVNVASFVSSSSSEYTWGTTSGARITAASILDDIVDPGGGAPATGTVFALAARYPGIGGAILYTASGLTANLAAITTAPNVDSYWRAILAGDTTILAPENHVIIGAGDFITVANETVTGGNDVYVEFAPGESLYHPFYGDAVEVASGSLTGGADNLTYRSIGSFAGDVGTNHGTLIGGNDILLVDLAASGSVSSFLSGDANGNDGDVTGGADRLTVRKTTGIFLFVAGDVGSSSAGTVRGGDDIIRLEQGARTFDRLAGDVFQLDGGTLLAGSDTITGSTAADRIYGDAAYVSGGAIIATDATHTGNDKLYGGDGADQLFGQIGNDILDGGTGDDLLVGGVGNDTFFVDSLLDVVNESAGEGSDTVRATVHYALSATASIELLATTGYLGTAAIDLTGSDIGQSLAGNHGVNELNGGGGNDFLNAWGGNDTLNGGTGDDTLQGGTGSDTYFVDSALDMVKETDGQGTDTVRASVDYALSTMASIELLATTDYLGTTAIDLTGSDIAQNIAGNHGVNELKGGGGNDFLNAWGDNDVLVGGLGADRLAGGLGADQFRFLAVAESTAAVRDRINDFSQGEGDRIDLSAIDANGGIAGDAAFTFIGAAAFTNTAGQLRAFQSGGNTFVEADINGNSIADLSVLLLGAHSLVQGNFIL